MRLGKLDGLKEHKSFPPNEGYRSRGDEKDGGRNRRVCPPISDKPARGICRRGHDWRRRQSFRRDGRGRPQLGVLRRIRQTAVPLAIRGRASSGHAERKSVSATR